LVDQVEAHHAEIVIADPNRDDYGVDLDATHREHPGCIDRVADAADGVEQVRIARRHFGLLRQRLDGAHRQHLSQRTQYESPAARTT
jgi:hypothetical protein